MLIDMHAHTSGISRCCRAEAQAVLQAAQDHGIDGLILCNHYQEIYVTEEGPAALAEAYIREYLHTEALAKEMGIQLFFGVEVTAKRHNNAHILIYGVEPEFVRQYPTIYEEPLEKMYSMAHAHGGIVVQAHPFRSGGHVLDTAYLDGIEVNCHPLYDDTHCERILKIAQDEHIFVTCGGDYHADTYRAVCGTYFPDTIRTSMDIVNHLKSSEKIKLHVHELRTEDHHDVVFLKA